MKKNIYKIIGVTVYLLFLILSFVFDFTPGKEIGHNFISFAVNMFKMMPCVFILIGLFEVWANRETVEKHLGKDSGIKGYIWALLLAGTTVGGLFVAFPVAYSLCRKGAKLSVIFTYIGASAICRVPLTIFEATFLGIKFTLIRLFVSVPLVVLTSMLLGKYLTKKEYKIMEGN
ncbi:MAG: permease [Candidatus Omnitrophica bacterium]|nr:permease [Candidatus Omnitrophota bacterium]